MNNKPIEGFFGLFDILGYKKLIENNDLTKLIEIFNEYILDIDKRSVTIDGIDRNQMLSFPSQPEVQTLVFSDTIILYQEKSENLLDLTPSILLKSCLLLRFAFEGGIPLRGAISYGKYYVHDKCFLGKPIIEAYEDEKKQDWSGAVLCKSAEEKIQALFRKTESTQSFNYRGITINPMGWFMSFLDQLLYRYSVPYKDQSNEEKRLALCWDDFMVDFAGLEDIPELNRGKNKSFIKNRVQEQFARHKKPIDKVKRKIDNTAKFMFKSKHRPLRRVRLQYTPEDDYRSKGEGLRC